MLWKIECWTVTLGYPIQGDPGILVSSSPFLPSKPYRPRCASKEAGHLERKPTHCSNASVSPSLLSPHPCFLFSLFGCGHGSSWSQDNWARYTFFYCRSREYTTGAELMDKNTSASLRGKGEQENKSVRKGKSSHAGLDHEGDRRVGDEEGAW